ncbi:hypothetical protein [Lutimaribacter pacificus]|uniref:hypothetical protein n=1 Tax=Lutimaribacter pacificus TaxID=391948 RepID=UPI00165FDB1C|nr:hypothetical protein [Lutimaribacter pacificus]
MAAILPRPRDRRNIAGSAFCRAFSSKLHEGATIAPETQAFLPSVFASGLS